MSIEKSIERLVAVETKLNELSKKIDDHIIEQRKDFDILSDKIDSLPDKFAGKWVEKGFWLLAGAMLTAAIGVLIIL